MNGCSIHFYLFFLVLPVLNAYEMGMIFERLTIRLGGSTSKLVIN